MKPNKVLVIDDSRLIHKMFRVLLQGAEVVDAMDGREALQLLNEHPDVDLVVLDINMPKMNGLEFLDQVKKDKALAEIPVVIISTEGKEEDTIRGLEAGAVAYVKKPFEGGEVMRIVERL